MQKSTAEIYNNAALQWQRSQPLLLSDYTARPRILELCEPIAEKTFLDMGCGEGYMARQLKNRGAASIIGFDISENMIAAAKQSEMNQPLGIDYFVSSATALPTLITNRSFDCIIAVFLFNYLSITEMQLVMNAIRPLLKPNGHFIFSVPHPSISFLRTNASFTFDAKSYGYFSGRDQLFEGSMHRRDGIAVPVRNIHKTFQDYFCALQSAGFKHMPEIEELHVSEEQVKLDPTFFGPLQDLPLHVVFKNSV